jgi:tetratricopeptide (TPR) repeat protein
MLSQRTDAPPDDVAERFAGNDAQGDHVSSTVRRGRRLELLVLGFFAVGVATGIAIGYAAWHVSESDPPATSGLAIQIPGPDQRAVELVNRGVDLHQLGDMAGAEASYLAALALEPTYALAQYNLGVVAHLAGDLSRAIEWYVKALEVDPSLASARFNLAVSFRDLGDTTAAIAQFEAILETSPDDANVLYNLALVVDATGDRARATALISQAQRLNPQLPGLP